ncbi:hypothetical protein FNF27_04368 [Cafeteria roenbergensis]|uniref:EF-hand domain-containing protein n=1 Tax=Cafeteria roenbergensis TaxID=33653 RepID=A0A5A8EBP0_CAFRO|nr:hypothetical protein FNF27_04368 [Cafeteria roenbergensis]|mmetsp:Transcript_20315/g.78020  ORF Transcript_20315/g.78020 Transcript_20315/m.78020 type:complete len:145 (-) Transcript_20315:227-661(-)
MAAVAEKDLPELSDELKRMLTDLFNELDRDGNGSLDAEEFVILGRAIGWDKTSRSVAQSQINKADKDSNGTLELAEWLNFSRRLALRGEAAAKRMVERLTAIVKKELDLIAADAAAGRGPPRDAGGSEPAHAADSRPAPAGAKP